MKFRLLLFCCAGLLFAFLLQPATLWNNVRSLFAENVTTNDQVAPAAQPQAALPNVLAAISRAFPVAETEDYQAIGYPGSHKVVRDSDNGLYIAFRGKFKDSVRTAYQIYLFNSADQGQKWRSPGAPIYTQADGTITPDLAGYNQRSPSITIDQNKFLHIVWYGLDARADTCDTHANERDDRQIKYARSIDGGKTWQFKDDGHPNLITVPMAEETCNKLATNKEEDLWQEHPVIYAAPSLDLAMPEKSTLFVAWEGREEQTGGKISKPRVEFIKSTDGGLTWHNRQAIAPQGATADLTTFLSGAAFSRPTMTVSGTQRAGAETIYLFAYATNQYAQAVWTSSLDGGDTWQPWQWVNQQPSKDQRHISVARDCNGDLHAVWREGPSKGSPGSTSRIYYAKYRVSAGIWGERATVSTNTKAYQFFPSIKMQRNCAAVWVVWIEADKKWGYPSEDPLDGRIYVRSKVGTVWQTPTLLSTNSPTVKALYPTLSTGRYSSSLFGDVVWLEATPNATGTCEIDDKNSATEDQHACRVYYATLFAPTP